jgi:hypothetical protein
VSDCGDDCGKPLMAGDVDAKPGLICEGEREGGGRGHE